MQRLHNLIPKWKRGWIAVNAGRHINNSRFNSHSYMLDDNDGSRAEHETQNTDKPFAVYRPVSRGCWISRAVPCYLRLSVSC